MNHVLKFLCYLSAIGMSLLASSCFHDNPNSLNLTFVSYATGRPVAGVTVVLHNADRVTYAAENVKTSGEDGKVQFEKLEQDRATYSVFRNDGDNSLSIDTYVDFPVGTGVLRLFTAEVPDSDCDRTAQVTVNGIPSNTATLAVSAGPWSIWTGGGHSNNGTFAGTISICDERVQDDGKISLLTSAFNENYETVRYGYLLDQDVRDGGSYSVTLDRVPAVIPWSTQPSLPLDHLAVYGIRKGVEYYAGGILPYFEDLKNFGSNGTVMLPIEFPFDRQIVLAGATDGARDRSLLAAIPALDATTPLTLEFDAALDVRDLNYDADTGRFTWSSSGAQDLTTLYVSSSAPQPSGDYSYVNWEVILSPETHSWSIPDLPGVEGVRQLIANDHWAALSVVDYSAASSINEAAGIIYMSPVNFTDIVDLLGSINNMSIYSETLASPELTRRRALDVPPSRPFLSNRPLDSRRMR